LPVYTFADATPGALRKPNVHCAVLHLRLFRRYKLPAEAAPKSAAAAVALAAIDAREPDAELRADLMANALLVPLLGKHSEAQPTDVLAAAGWPSVQCCGWDMLLYKAVQGGARRAELNT
jgi:hypothetical protein